MHFFSWKHSWFWHAGGRLRNHIPTCRNLISYRHSVFSFIVTQIFACKSRKHAFLHHILYLKSFNLIENGCLNLYDPPFTSRHFGFRIVFFIVFVKNEIFFCFSLVGLWGGGSLECTRRAASPAALFFPSLHTIGVEKQELDKSLRTASGDDVFHTAPVCSKYPGFTSISQFLTATTEAKAPIFSFLLSRINKTVFKNKISRQKNSPEFAFRARFPDIPGEKRKEGKGLRG